MDPATLAIVLKQLVPLFGMLFVFGMPVAIVWTAKHFKLKNRELELEAQLHGKELELRLRTLEARQAAIESAFGALGGRFPTPLQDRPSMVETPGSSADPADISN